MTVAYARTIAINALIVFGASFVAGFIVGFIATAAHFAPQLKTTLLISLGWLAVIAGFVYVGRKTPTEGYWITLSHTALATWILSAVQILVGVSPIQWVASLIMTMLTMGIGGGIARAIKRG